MIISAWLIGSVVTTIMIRLAGQFVKQILVVSPMQLSL
jgi:hypothetical protein